MNSRKQVLEIPFYVRALAMGLPAIGLGLTVQSWLSLPSKLASGFLDFRLPYAAGYMVRTGHGSQLYDLAMQKYFHDSLVSPLPRLLPFIHPAYESLLYVPLSLLPFREAYWVFFLINLGLLTLCFHLLRPHLIQLTTIWPALPYALFLGFAPLCPALIEGQDSILLLTLLCASFVNLENRELLSGLLVGLGVFRFHLVLPLAVLFVVWRRWRFSIGFALSSLTCGVVSLLIAPYGSYLNILRHLNDAGLYSMLPKLMPNLRGLGHLVAPHHPEVFVIVASALLLASVAIWRPSSIRKGFLAAATLSVLTGYHVLAHDFTLLLLPIGVTLSEEFLAPALLFASCWLLVLYVPLPAVLYLSTILKVSICGSTLFLLAGLCGWFSKRPHEDPQPVWPHKVLEEQCCPAQNLT
jgi:hypothetical protein